MMTPNGKNELTARHDRLILAMLERPTLAEAAQAAGVSEKTARRWRTMPAFQAAYRKARGEAFSQAVGRLAAMCGQAAAVLGDVMADNDAPHHARVSAAVAVLRYARDGVELDDLAQRIEQLEQVTPIERTDHTFAERPTDEDLAAWRAEHIPPTNTRNQP